jgi:hypothetical protein
MSTSLKARLYFAATQNAGLSALLLSGSPGVFRWFDQQLVQSSGFPAIVVSQVSNPRTYGVSGRLPTSSQRMQFSVYGAGNDSQNADLVVNALTSFLDGFAGGGIAGLSQQSNLIVGDRDFGIANTNPLTYLRVVDVLIFSNDTI